VAGFVCADFPESSEMRAKGLHVIAKLRGTAQARVRVHTASWDPTDCECPNKESKEGCSKSVTFKGAILRRRRAYQGLGLSWRV